MANSKLKCGVVGVGYLGRFHAMKLKQIQQAELVGVYDMNGVRAQAVANELEVKAFAQLSEMTSLDAVTIACSTKAHYEVAKFFLEKKIAVNIEKPMTATLLEAQDLARIQKMSGTPLMVGHIERFNPVILELKEKAKKARHIELKRLGPFKTRGSDVNVLFDLAIHDVDLALWLTGSEPLEIQCSGSRLATASWDSAQVFMKMKNGIQVQMDISRVNPVGQRSIRMVCENEIVHINSADQNFQIVSRNQKVEKESDWPLQIDTFQLEKSDALFKESESFVNAILNKKNLPITVQDGLRAMEIVDQIEKDLERHWGRAHS